jgi:hypothetical protein
LGANRNHPAVPNARRPTRGILAGWNNGDFNYDRTINRSDYLLTPRPPGARSLNHPRFPKSDFSASAPSFEMDLRKNYSIQVIEG